MLCKKRTMKTIPTFSKSVALKVQTCVRSAIYWLFGVCVRACVFRMRSFTVATGYHVAQWLQMELRIASSASSLQPCGSETVTIAKWWSGTCTHTHTHGHPQKIYFYTFMGTGSTELNAGGRHFIGKV